jgi:GH15 family glucan-1,4-alpha-glucosidase
MGLPERIGGERNYDYRYAWLRDANLTLEAMLALGCRDQVHVSLGWLLRTIRATHPRLRPMYRLDGGTELPDAELGLDGHRRSRPVTLGNSAQDQLQLGNYGDVFDMAWRYVRDGNALAPGEGRRLADLAEQVCQVWQRPDAGIWELSDAQHYTQSKLACWVALDRARRLAACGQLPDGAVARWSAQADAIGRFVRERCWSERRRAFARAAGSDELDAAVLLAARGGLWRDEPERFGATIDAIRRELGAGGGLLYRYTGMHEQEGAFLACSFWLADGLAHAGRVDEAAELMDGLVARGNDVGLFSEEIDPGTGAFLGNLPQALTHLSLVNAAVSISRA